MNPKIATITSNADKHSAYQKNMERYKRAKSGGFYLEAIFILYALIEDRLSAFLFYAGVTNATGEKITRNAKVRPLLNRIVETLNSPQPNVRKAGAKIKTIKELLAWSTEYAVCDPALSYLDVLCKLINRTKGKDNILPTLTRIEEWCVFRNELVHALLNKKVENQEESLPALVEEGEACNRALQNFVKSFKSRNTLRKKFNIQ